MGGDSSGKNHGRWWWGLGCAVLLVVAVILCSPIFLIVLMAAGSQRTVFQRSISPDGWNEARVQFDDAGAVSSFDRIVLVKSRLNPSDEPLLSCRAFLAEGENTVHLRWLDDHTLLIQHAFPPQAISASTAHCGSIRIVTKSIIGAPSG